MAKKKADPAAVQETPAVVIKSFKGFDANMESGAASATGERGAASATGWRGAASATGKHSVAMASGESGKAMAQEGCAIVVCYRNDNGELIHIRASKVGDNGIKPDVWYSLDADGNFKEAE